MLQRILLVEGRRDLRVLFSVMLSRAGYQVTTAENQAGAWELAQKEKFDLYVVSYFCRDGLGTHLCRRLRTDGVQAPIVLWSVDALPVEQEKAMASGATVFVTDGLAILNMDETVARLLA